MCCGSAKKIIPPRAVALSLSYENTIDRFGGSAGYEKNDLSQFGYLMASSVTAVTDSLKAAHRLQSTGAPSWRVVIGGYWVGTGLDWVGRSFLGVGSGS